MDSRNTTPQLTPDIPGYMPICVPQDSSTTQITHRPKARPVRLQHSLSNVPSLKTFTLPFHTIIVRSVVVRTASADSETQLFVRESTLAQIPYFQERLACGDLHPGEDFYMLDEVDDAASLALLFGFVESGVVPEIFEDTDGVFQSSTSDSENNDKALQYIRAYPLAVKLGIEKVQNDIIDKLIRFFLEHRLVSPRDVGILIRSGHGTSRLCILLMEEMARGFVDHRYIIDRPSENIVPEITRNIAFEDEIYESIETDATAQISTSGPETNVNILQDPSTLSKEAISEACARTSRLIVDNQSFDDEEIPRSFLQEIETQWTIREATTFIGMMAKAFTNAQDPISRSPIELAAAQPCEFHNHTVTHVCVRKSTTQERGTKRKRLEQYEEEGDSTNTHRIVEEESNEEDQDNATDIDTTERPDVDDGDDDEIQIVEKENGEPNEEGTKPPDAKKRRFNWLFRG